MHRLRAQFSLPVMDSFTCLASDGTRSWGENICCGYGLNTNAAQAFESWSETDKDYAHQGHRRNMLNKDFQTVGVAHVRYGGCDYWAQEFGSGKAGGSASDKFSAKTVSATWKTLAAGKTKISASAKEITVAMGDTAALPKVLLTSRSGAKNSLHGVKWSLPNSKVAKISGSKLVPVKKGTTELKVKVNGTEVKVKVTVADKGNKKGDATEALEDYLTPLGTEEEYYVVDEEEPAYEEGTDLSEEAE